MNICDPQTKKSQNLLDISIREVYLNASNKYLLSPYWGEAALWPPGQKSTGFPFHSLRMHQFLPAEDNPEATLTASQLSKCSSETDFFLNTPKGYSCTCSFAKTALMKNFPF